MDLARREAQRADKAFRQHPNYKRAVDWNKQEKADKARLAVPQGKDAPQIDLEISEAKARTATAQRAAERAAASPQDLLRQMDVALLDRKKALAELPRDNRAEHELATDLAAVRALRQRVERNDRPRAEAMADALEGYKGRARYWQEVAERITRENTRRVLRERLLTLQALRQAVEREEGIKRAQRDELVSIERDRHRVEQLLKDVDGFAQGKPKPLPAIEAEQKRLAADRQRLTDVSKWAEEQRALAREQARHRPSRGPSPGGMR